MGEKKLDMSGKTMAKLKKKAGEKSETVHKPTIRAMVWYREEHYLNLLSLFEDADLLPVTYRDWLDRAEEKKIEVEAAGDQVIKVFIDPETFPKWCANKNLVMDANARSEMAIEVAQARSFTL